MGEQTKKPQTRGVNHDNIFAALSAFQGELKTIDKDGKVKFNEVEFKYTTLGKIMETIYPMLGKHGLSVHHETSFTEDGSFITAILTSETSGELNSGKVPFDAKNGDMKKVGASITYARRYSLTMLLGIASEEDKDAELLEKSSQNAKKFAFGRAKDSINKANTLKELEKATEILKKDMEHIDAGKAPALGLSMDEYIGLLEFAEVRSKEINEDNQSQ